MTQHIGMCCIFNDFLQATYWTKDAGFESKDIHFATKCKIPFACIQNFSVCLADAEKVL